MILQHTCNARIVEIISLSWSDTHFTTKDINVRYMKSNILNTFRFYNLGSDILRYWFSVQQWNDVDILIGIKAALPMRVKKNCEGEYSWCIAEKDIHFCQCLYQRTMAMEYTGCYLMVCYRFKDEFQDRLLFKYIFHRYLNDPFANFFEISVLVVVIGG